jgi:hypothetical protein
LQAVAFAVLIGTIRCATLHAQTSAECPVENLDACTRYQHLLAGMDSGNFVVQLSSLRAASEELDPALRSLIFGKALKSTDLKLRTAGLRYVLASKNALDVVIESPVHPTPAQEKVYNYYSMLVVQNLKFDEKTDELTGFVFSYQAKGSMTRGGFELTWPYCRLHLTAGEEDVLRGTLSCQQVNAPLVELQAQIELD